MIYYVYIYLDPRKPGNFKYQSENICLFFEYEPFYVGKGKFTRCFDHLNFVENRLLRNQPIKFDHTKSKIKTILEVNLKPIISIIIDNLNEQKAFDLEVLFIKTIGRDKQNGPLTNKHVGGTGIASMFGKKHSEETKRKMSVSSKGKAKLKSSIEKGLKTKRNRIYTKKNFTEDHKNKISQAVSGENNGMFGKKHTEKSKQQMSESRTSDGNGMFGKTHTEKSKNKIREKALINFKGEGNPMFNKIGDKNPNFGKRHIYNTALNESKVVNIAELDNYLSEGWLRGMFKNVKKEVNSD